MTQEVAEIFRRTINLDPEQFAFEAYGVYDSYQMHKRLLRIPNVERRVRVAFERLLADARAVRLSN